MKTENARWFLMFSIVAAFTVGRADDVAVLWDGSGNTAESSPIAVVSDDTGAIVSLTASPAEGGTIFIDGEPMNFADGATISLATPGSLVFSNDVSSAGTLKVGEDDPDAEISYSGDIVSGKEYVPLFRGKQLADYEVKSTYFKYPNGCDGYALLLGPQGYGTPECVEWRKESDGTDVMRVLMQQFNNDFLCSVEVFLKQNGEDIAGKINCCRYSYGHLNLLGLDLQKYYNNGKLYAEGVDLVVWRGVATVGDIGNPNDDTKGFGINQLTMKRRAKPRIVRFAADYPGQTLVISKGTRVECENSFFEKPVVVSGSGDLTFLSTGNEVSYSNIYESVILKSDKVVSCKRSLRDLVSVDGWFRNVNTVHSPLFMRAHHLKIAQDGKSATCQFQRLVGDVIFCMVVQFTQSKYEDILVRSLYGRNHKTEVEVNGEIRTFDVGVDFLDGSLPAIASSTVVEDISSWGLFLRDLTLTFSTPKASIVLGGANMSADRSSLMLRGTAEVPQVMRVVDLGGLPTNGFVTVGPYSVLDIAITNTPPIHGTGVSGGGTDIIVQTNGLLRLSQIRAFATKGQKVRLFGGEMEVGYGMLNDNRTEYHHYANDLTLADGARVYGTPVRAGFRMAYPAWRVIGTVPSVCDSCLLLLDFVDAVDTVFNLYVEDVTKDAQTDFTMNGRINRYQDNTTFDDVTVTKTGEGTVLQNGVSELKYETLIKRGAWVFGKSGVSEGKQEFRLEGGTTLGLAAGVSNGLGKVLVKAPAKLSFSEDTLLTLDELVLDENARLDIEGTFGKRSLHVAASLSESMLSRISCPEGRVMQDDEGYIRPRIKPLVITVR